jgi:F-type H+-transporting ATPase subunit epsilon
MLTVRSADGEEQYFALSRGVVQIEKNSIKILSDIADRVDALDEQSILDARKRAEDLVASRRQDNEGFIEATALLDRELARLKSVRRRRSRSL